MRSSEVFSDGWEQRWDPLLREWVVYSPHRNERPWKGAVAPTPPSLPAYDPDCYLCPGNSRIQGKRNPRYEGIFVFDNDRPVVSGKAPPIADPPSSAAELFLKSRASGCARVMCYDPRHNVTLAEISTERVAEVFESWRRQTEELSSDPSVKHVLIFENKGEVVGVSNPHPHCQIYATNFTFRLIERENESIDAYRVQSGKNLFEEILTAERKEGKRIVAEDDHSIAFVPFFARFAYETMVFPKRRHATFLTMEGEEIFSLARTFQEVVRRYDSVFGFSFPYVLSVHQAPVGEGWRNYHLHLLVQPPLRRPGLQKFLAGPEIGGGNFMADTIPEEKAKELREADLSRYEGGFA